MKRLFFLLLLLNHVTAMEVEKEFAAQFELFHLLPIELQAYIVSFIPQDIQCLLLVNSKMRDLAQSDVFLRSFAQMLVSTNVKEALSIYKYAIKHSKTVLITIFYDTFACVLEKLNEEEAIAYITHLAELNLKAASHFFCMAAGLGHTKVVAIFLALKNRCVADPVNELNVAETADVHVGKLMSYTKAFFYRAGFFMKKKCYCQQLDTISGCISAQLPLEQAAAHGHLDMAVLLLEHGADVNFYEKRKKYCSTVLINAAKRGDKEMVHLFLNYGARINYQDSNGMSALMVSATEGHEHVVKLLLAQQVIRINGRNNKDNTALMLAACQGHNTTVQLLLEAGADPAIKNCFGKTAKKLAEENGHHEIVDMLALYSKHTNRYLAYCTLF